MRSKAHAFNKLGHTTNMTLLRSLLRDLADKRVDHNGYIESAKFASHYIDTLMGQIVDYDDELVPNDLSNIRYYFKTKSAYSECARLIFKNGDKLYDVVANGTVSENIIWKAVLDRYEPEFIESAIPTLLKHKLNSLALALALIANELDLKETFKCMKWGFFKAKGDVMEAQRQYDELRMLITDELEEIIFEYKMEG